MISTEITRLQSAKAALKTAINAKNDSNHQIDDETLEDYAGFVNNISTGSSATLVTKSITANGTYNASNDNADGYSEVTVNVQPPQEAKSKDVNFYDYDGKILYSYTASEFAQLTEMPANPTHTGLTSEGWNWTLADAKTQVTAIGACDIGQMYATTDGKTRLYCHFPEELKSFYLGLGINGTISIDWGDNTTDTATGGSRSTVTNTAHTYTNAGDYVITITVSSGNFAFLGSSNSSYLFRKSTTNASYIHAANGSCLKRVEIGSGAYLGNYSFCKCYNLESVTAPKTLPTSVGTYVFHTCTNLKHFTMPYNSSAAITSVPNYMFYGCNHIKSISLTKGITSFGNYAFYQLYSMERFVMPSVVSALNANCIYTSYGLRELYVSTALTSAPGTSMAKLYSVTKLTLPATLTSISSKAFQDNYGMKEYHFKSTTVPTLDNTDAFSNIQSDCKIYVPSAKLTNYQTAQNWSSYSSQMVGE